MFPPKVSCFLVVWLQFSHVSPWIKPFDSAKVEYRFVPKNVPLLDKQESETLCQSLNGKVASPTDQETIDILRDEAKKLTKNNWWLGLYDPDLDRCADLCCAQVSRERVRRRLLTKGRLLRF